MLKLRGAVNYRTTWLVSVVAAGLADPALAAKSKKTEPQIPPMTFTIVRESKDLCPSDCPKWIAAEGQITSATPAALGRVLKAMGKQRLPIFVISPGGDVDAAVKMGRMVRARHMDVAVGKTVLDDCAKAPENCKDKKASNAPKAGVVFSTGVPCLSACPFFLAGGERRFGGATALLGVHQIRTTMNQKRVYYRETYRIQNGKKKVVSRKIVKTVNAGSYVTTKVPRATARSLTGYLKEMGVNPDLYKLMEQVPYDTIRILTGAEQNEFKLVTAPQLGTELVSPQLCKTTPPAENCENAGH
jgi:hypothetical protein